MYIEDKAELSMFPEYIQRWLNEEYSCEDYPQDIIEFENMYRLNADKTAQECFGIRGTIHNIPRGLLDILFDKPFNNEHGDFKIDYTTAKYYGLDALTNIHAVVTKGPRSIHADDFTPKIFIPITDMKYPVDENVNIQSGPSDMFKYIHNNTFDMMTTARKSFASAFASYCMSEDALDDDDVAGVKTKMEKILRVYKPDYKDEDFNWKSPYLFPMIESIFNKLPADRKKACSVEFNTLSAIHQGYYDIGYEEILSKTRMEIENVYDITFEIQNQYIQYLVDRINKLNTDPNLQELRDTSETLLFIKWILDKYEEQKIK